MTTAQQLFTAAARAASGIGLGPAKGSDSRFFASTKKGEIQELREELASTKIPVKRDAIKKVIAAMTVGKDVSSLFPDMINSMQTNNLEIKKLVYLYVINYSKSQPDLAVMGVNTFRRDANDPNPLIRALAIRTMGCVRVDKIVEYLCEPLRRCLKDENAYVRKTAALTVAKLNELDPELCEDQGFVESLRELISDPFPAVVANAVAALADISQNSEHPEQVFQVTQSVLHKLLAALNECSEWGQVFILDALGTYTVKDATEAETIIDRVTPRLQHSNAAVVMGAVKVVVRFIDSVSDQDVRRLVSKKLAPPLVTLISSNAPEIQYVALRNIQLIVTSRPEILAKDCKVFFCKFNDPLYVKMEKLEVLILLVRDNTAELVLGELKEYASEVDVEFVRRAVRAIGRTAIKLERAAERCVNVLIELIRTRINYVVQEAIVTIKDIFRRYPNRYESVIAVLCENLESLDEPLAKASMIWIVGENADRIDNAGELLETFVDTFFDEVAEVQLQLLTAAVKLFLVRPDSRALMERVLKLATEESDNPDLRDRAFIYWRLLSTDPEAAKRVVLGEKPVIEDDTSKIDPALLLELTENLSSLSSVYHKPARSFVRKVVRPITHEGGLAAARKEVTPSATPRPEDREEDEAPRHHKTTNNGGGDLIDFGGSSTNNNDGEDVEDRVHTIDVAPSMPLLLDGKDEAKSGGLHVCGQLKRSEGLVRLELIMSNPGKVDLGDKFAIKFNVNTFALAPVKSSFTLDGGPLSSSGTTRRVSIPLKIDPNNANRGAPPSLDLELALKISKTGFVAYFHADLPFYVLFLETTSPISGPASEAWATSQASLQEITGRVETWPSSDVTGLLAQHNVVHLGQEYYSLATSTGSNCLVKLEPSTSSFKVRCSQKQVLPFVAEALSSLLKSAAKKSSAKGGMDALEAALAGSWPTATTTSRASPMDDLFGGGAPSAPQAPASNSNNLLDLF